MTKTSIRHPYYLITTTIAGLMLWAGPAHAQLGSTTVANAGSPSGRVLQHAKSGQLSFDEVTDANGITVRRYVDSSGLVYAVSWRGAAMPDLQALLGSHFRRYQSAAASSSVSSGLHASTVSQADLVVESGVRLRQFVGRAWLTGALPAGVVASDIE